MRHTNPLNQEQNNETFFSQYFNIGLNLAAPFLRRKARSAQSTAGLSEVIQHGAALRPTKTCWFQCLPRSLKENPTKE